MKNLRKHWFAAFFLATAITVITVISADTAVIADEPDATTPVNQIGGFEVKAINAGAMIRWNPMSNGLGYRLYRTENADDEGIPMSDFYLTSNEFIDANVKPSTTYYYSVRQVIKEAVPLEDLKEELGPATEKVSVTTNDKILGESLASPEAFAQKRFILMTLEDPYMSLNGETQEIDPGRGTAPKILNSRTLVPIRAIVEGMGGSVEWNNQSREITLGYGFQNVIMKLDSDRISVNGEEKTIDVPPTSINDRTMVPIRFAAENLGCEVEWLDNMRKIVVVFY